MPPVTKALGLKGFSLKLKGDSKSSEDSSSWLFETLSPRGKFYRTTWFVILFEIYLASDYLFLHFIESQILFIFALVAVLIPIKYYVLYKRSV
jgi:hypothetical protein